MTPMVLRSSDKELPLSAGSFARIHNLQDVDEVCPTIGPSPASLKVLIGDLLSKISLVNAVKNEESLGIRAGTKT
jgi:hypothetical protein